MQENMNSAKVGYKEETGASNHQIANLLLNLASRGNHHGSADQAGSGETEAMDLTKYRKPKQACQEKPTPVASSKPTPAPSSLYSGLGCLGSPFLLQNLQVHDIISHSTKSFQSHVFPSRCPPFLFSLVF